MRKIGWKNAGITIGLTLVIIMVVLINPIKLFGAQLGGETKEEQYDKGGLEPIEVIEVDILPNDDFLFSFCENELPQKFSNMDERYWKNFSSSFYYEQMSDEIKNMWNQLEQACILVANTDRNCSSVSIQLGSQNSLSKQEIVEFIYFFKYSNPQYYFLSNKMFINRSDGKVYIGIYLYEGFENGVIRRNATAVFTQKINEWVNTIEEGKYDEDKVKIAHDLVAKNTDYGYGTYDQSAYSMVCEGVTVCAGYTAVFQMLLNAVDIDAAEVTSDSHAWNIVRIHGYWYNVDVTWADSTTIIYDYYNKSDVTFRKNTNMHNPESLWSGLLPEMKYDSVSLRRSVYKSAYIQDDLYVYFIVNSNPLIESFLVKAVGVGGISGDIPQTVTYNDNIYFVVNADKLSQSINGLRQGEDGIWYYYNHGIIDNSFTGMVQNEYGWWYIIDGKLDWTYTGMAENEYGWWYYQNGQLDWTYTGMAENEYGWWYYQNGKLDWTYTGMAENEYGWWYYQNGQLDWTYTGMAENEYGWWYYQNGRLDWTYTGMAENEYGWWYYSNGMINWTYTGWGENQYGQWYFYNGSIVYD